MEQGREGGLPPIQNAMSTANTICESSTTRFRWRAERVGLRARDCMQHRAGGRVGRVVVQCTFGASFAAPKVGAPKPIAVPATLGMPQTCPPPL